MSLITNKQQDLINELVTSYLRNYDKVARQYINLRRSIYENFSKILQELEGPQKLNSAQAEFELDKLRYEYVKLDEIYKLHVRNLLMNLNIGQDLSVTYTDKLDGQHGELISEKEDLSNKISNLRDQQAPVLNDMRVLVKNFENGLNTRLAKKMRKVLRERLNERYDENSKEISPNSFVFSASELYNIFGDAEHFFQQLNENTDSGNRSAEINELLDLKRYLDEYLQNSKTTFRTENDSFIYDISKSTFQDFGTTHTNVDDYDSMVDQLLTHIRDLIEHGTQSKTRWNNNAHKLDAIKETLKTMEPISE